MLSALVATALATPVDRVPEDFATIQQAVDEGSAPMISVGPGTWQGATVTRPVRVFGSGAVIVEGVRSAGERVAFALPRQATDSTIEGFVIDCASSGKLDLGVLGSARRLDGVADHVTVRDNTFLGCVQGVTNAGPAEGTCESSVAGGAYWVVEGNQFHGIATRSDRGVSGGGVGVLIYNAEGADVRGNSFDGTVDDRRDFATSGISLAGCIDCSVSDNNFAMNGAEHWFTAVHNGGAQIGGAVASRNLQLVDNDAGRHPYPWLDVAYASRASVATELVANSGVAYVDHELCGDGDLRIELPGAD